MFKRSWFNHLETNQELLMKRILPFLLLPFFLLPGFTQDEDRKAKRGKMQTEMLNFIEEHMPGKSAELEKILEQEGKKAHREAMMPYKDMYLEYQDILEFEGDEYAESFLKQAKIAMKMEPLFAAYEAADGDKEAQAIISKELEPHVIAMNKAYAADLQSELEYFREEIVAMEKELKEIQAENKDPKKAVEAYLSEMETEIDSGDADTELPENWHVALTDAQAASKKSGKPIHVVFSTSWCGPCKAMVKGVYPKDEVKKALEAFEPLYIDGDKYPQVCKTYKVRGFPTFIVIDAEGGTLKSKVGGMDSDTFIKWLGDK